MSEAPPSLKRAVGPLSLTLYGVGSMLGAGIYGLVGQAAGLAGPMIWLSFLVAMIAALFTAVSYASLSSRYPKSAGEAYAVDRAWRKPWLSYLVGMTIVAAGMASVATQSRVVGANLNSLLGVEAPVSVMAIGFLLVVAGLVYRGITESLIANLVCTIIEAAGLLFVIAAGISWWGDADLLQAPAGEFAPAAALIMQGSVLTFFSFLGFEDMINVAEEVKNPERNMPLAVIGAVLIVSLIYMAVAITAVSVVPWEELSHAPAPLQAVIERAAPWFPTAGFILITIMAVANTALVNYVMCSRLIYGMARERLLPEAFGRVHHRRQTPHIAIAILLVAVVILQFMGDISQLASATVLLLLVVFGIVNGSLIVLSRREGKIAGAFNAPLAAPIAGLTICLFMAGTRLTGGDWRPVAVAGGLIFGIMVLYALTAPDRQDPPGPRGALVRLLRRLPKLPGSNRPDRQ